MVYIHIAVICQLIGVNDTVNRIDHIVDVVAHGKAVLGIVFGVLFGLLDHNGLLLDSLLRQKDFTLSGLLLLFNGSNFRLHLRAQQFEFVGDLVIVTGYFVDLVCELLFIPGQLLLRVLSVTFHLTVHLRDLVLQGVSLVDLLLEAVGQFCSLQF